MSEGRTARLDLAWPPFDRVRPQPAFRIEALTRLDRQQRLFAAVLAAVAGYLDGAGFLMTGGYFVSFMSGNSTRLAVSLSRAAGAAEFAASLVLAFVLGVVAGASLRRLKPRRPQPLILGALAALTAVSGAAAAASSASVAAILMAAAMGAENTIFAEAGQVRFGLTYMTGTLVRIGKGLAAELFGEARLAWLPHLLLWASLVAGAAAGAIAFDRLGPVAIWLAAAALAALALLARSVFPQGDTPGVSDP